MKAQKNNLMIVVVIVLLAVIYWGLDFKQKQNTTHDVRAQQRSIEVVIDDQQQIMQAYQQQRSNVQVQAQGIVKAVLPDDNEGSRHQKMILKLENGLTVLIAHNID